MPGATVKSLFILFLCFSSLIVFAQKKTATVSGKITDENDVPLAGVTVQVLNLKKNTLTNDSGYFKIELQANKAVALVFSYTGFLQVQKNFNLSAGTTQNIIIKMQHTIKELKAVTVQDDRDRKQAGLITIDPTKALVNPSPITAIESLIKIFVGSNNELTSQYSVRGGSYDENLIYVNDFEVYRPYLVRSGQQEGLSFINPELTSNVKFYNGGFQAKYGDKMSSVLDVTYKKPVRNGGSAYFGLLEQGIHLEGIAKNNKVTYLIGLRNRTNQNLLSSQETKGNYVPSSSDLQALITWQVNNKWRFEALGNLSKSKFSLTPTESQLTAAVFSPLYSQNLGLDIFFDGHEKDAYSTNFVGLTAVNQRSKKLQLKWLLSYFNDNEAENIDITGAYLFGEREYDPATGHSGAVVNPLGAGINQDYARNKLNINVWNATHKGSLDKGKHFLQWGNSIERQVVNDKLHEWTYNDSAGYSLPYTPGNLSLFSSLNSKADFGITRFSGYMQDNIRFNDSSGFILNAGIRYNYNTLNKEFLVSPRLGFSFKPANWNKDIIIRGAAGVYVQPPFYREMRRYDGSINYDLKSQKSYQAVAGLDYNFKLFDRPARITTEAYYKYITDVVPYDIDNVRLRYYGNNNAKAYAAGIETRLFGEIVKDAESWISLGIMRTKENLDDDQYTTYQNAAGETITATSTDKIPADSTTNAVGWLRRPTDRLVTFGLFFQDYLSTNKNFKVYFSTLFGSNMPFNIPFNARYRNALEVPAYIRVDMGFSALLLDAEKIHRSHSPFRNFESIWASLEIFNVVDRANTISYQLVKDFANSTYAIPNRLTPRLLNIKFVASW
ncbi:carboxypeptidase-like regulatory domain-containing protein [soil metagenome]